MLTRRRVAVSVLAFCFAAAPAHAQSNPAPFDVVGTTITETQQAIREGRATCRSIVQQYLRRIAAYDQKPVNGLRLNAIVTLNPEALADADACDRNFQSTHMLPPLGGIAVLIKDNYDTAGLQTTGGSLAMKGFFPHRRLHGRTAPRRRRHRPRQNQHGRVGLQPLRHRKLHRRHHAQSLRPRLASPPAPAAAPPQPSPPASASPASAPTPATPFAARRRTTIWSAFVPPSASPAATASSRSSLTTTSAGRWRAPSPTRPRCSPSSPDPIPPIRSRPSPPSIPHPHRLHAIARSPRPARAPASVSFAKYFRPPRPDPEIKALTDRRIKTLQREGAIIVDPFTIPERKGLEEESVVRRLSKPTSTPTSPDTPTRPITT